MHLHPGRGAFLGDEPPAGAALQHKLHLTVELAQPLAEPDPVRRCDPTPLGLTRVQVDPVEGHLPVASRQYLREGHFVASFGFLRQPVSFQAVLTGGLDRGAFLAWARISSCPVRARICRDRAAGLIRLKAAFMVMIRRLVMASWVILLMGPAALLLAVLAAMNASHNLDLVLGKGTRPTDRIVRLLPSLVLLSAAVCAYQPAAMAYWPI